jgi:methylglutaconyl-CoA hydratase
MTRGVEVEVSARGIATILLDRPERSNAIDQAARIGLAHEVVPADQLDARVAEVVDAPLHGTPGAQRTLKDGMERFVTPTVEAIVAARSSHGSARTAEAQEGIASFDEKRKPSWYPP